MDIRQIIKKTTKPLEIYSIQAHSSTIDLSDEEIESIEYATAQGAGIRIIDRGSLGFSYTSDIRKKNIERILREASSNARYATRDRCNILASPAPSYPKVNIYDEELAGIPAEEKIRKVKEAAHAALCYDKRIKKVYKASYQDTTYKVSILNSQGVDISYSATSCSLGLMAIASRAGESQSGFEFDVQRFSKKLKAEEVGRRAAQRALSLLGAKKIRTQKIAVILDNLVVSSFLGLIASALSAEAVQRKRSLFRAKLDKSIAASGVNIVDDGTLKEGLGSAPCDDEGVPTSRKALIADGVLRSYLYNTYTAASEKRSSTGNGMRGSFKSLPGIGATNLFIVPGEKTKEELIEGMARGLYVTDALGMHMADSISGDFSIGVNGQWIEKGALSHPVCGVTIGGNLRELLKNIEGIGNDLRFVGSIGSPSLLVSRIMVSGT
jgi:PmbA protein